MASTLTFSDSAAFCSTLLKNQLLNVNNQQPGITMANIIKQRILGAPFIWRANRGHAAFAISQLGGTDYAQALPTLGRIETQWLTDAEGNDMPLQGAVALPKNSSVARPTIAAPQYDDNAGNITFRFNYTPDADYTANFDFQQKPTLMTSFGSLWGPVADEYGYLFNIGLLALAGLLVNDTRFPIWEKDFVSGLLATQDGLDEQAKAIFIGDWMNVTRTFQRSQAAGQTGAAGRAQ